MNGHPNRQNTPAIVWLCPLMIWLACFNVIGYFTWGYGLLTFALMVAATLFLPSIPAITGRLATLLPRSVLSIPGRFIRVCLILILIVLAVHMTIQGYTGFVKWKATLWDISLNTYSAAGAFLEGTNPYDTRTMLRGPGGNFDPAEISGMWGGFEYKYGFPYFPALFLTYAPFLLLVEGFNAMRLANLVFLLLNLVGIRLLTKRLAPPGSRSAANLIALVAYLGVSIYGSRIFLHTLPGIAISTYALYAFVAAASGWYRTAGLLFGLAQACKLLPGPLLVIPVLVWLIPGKGSRDLLVAYVATSAVIIGPYLLAQPGSFISATILFFLVLYRHGDNTSAWFFLPGLIQPIFQVAGWFLTAVAACLASLRRFGGSMVWPLAGSFTSFLVLMAFSKVTHLNYILPIHPLGCVAMGVLAVSGGKLLEARRGGSGQFT